VGVYGIDRTMMYNRDWLIERHGHWTRPTFASSCVRRPDCRASLPGGVRSGGFHLDDVVVALPVDQLAVPRELGEAEVSAFLS